jgi:hypothetical protein
MRFICSVSLLASKREGWRHDPGCPAERQPDLDFSGLSISWLFVPDAIGEVIFTETHIM